jgi:hypothetical protein
MLKRKKIHIKSQGGKSACGLGLLLEPAVQLAFGSYWHPLLERKLTPAEKLKFLCEECKLRSQPVRLKLVPRAFFADLGERLVG